MNFSILRFIAVAIAIKVVAADCYDLGLKKNLGIGSDVYKKFVVDCISSYRFGSATQKELGLKNRMNDCILGSVSILPGSKEYYDKVYQCVHQHRY
jgi:hypothetical protein